MSSFRNPIFLYKIAKCHVTDTKRIWTCNEGQLKKLQDKAIKRIVKYANTVPLYQKKFKEYGIKPEDIKGIQDITKLPIISKDDLRAHYPDEIIPKNFDKKDAFLLSTSGSTGEPVFMYYDRFTAIKILEGYVRALKAFGGDWRKSRIALIVDIKPGSIEHAAFTDCIPSSFKKLLSLKNQKIIYVGEKTEKILDELDRFNPDFIGSDPIMVKKLADLKSKGFGRNVNPKAMSCSGSILDKYSKDFVEKTFGCKLYNIYATTETGVIAFECKNNKHYHVNSDFVYVEYVDNDNNLLPPGKKGNIVVTRLFGNGTPIIRYSGLGDVVKPIVGECGCGIEFCQMIEYIEGRSMEMIILPDGSELAPFDVTTIPATVMNRLNSFKIKQFQIIQHKTNYIEVLIVIDEKQRKQGPSVEKIKQEIKKEFLEKTGDKVKTEVNEVDEIEKDIRTDHVKLLISKVKRKK